MEPARRKQLAHLNHAKENLLGWATANDVPLARVEFVVPFTKTSVWLFYDTNANVERCAATGTTTNVQAKFLSILSDNGYPANWLEDTSFQVDSHENVERNFQGSYFYRLR